METYKPFCCHKKAREHYFLWSFVHQLCKENSEYKMDEYGDVLEKSGTVWRYSHLLMTYIKSLQHEDLIKDCEFEKETI